MNEKPDYLSSPDQIVGGAALVTLCKMVGETLEKHYPGWLWLVAPDREGSVLSVHSLRLSAEWGYRWRLIGPGKDLLSDDPVVARRQIMRGAGEILERFGVPRSSYHYDHWMQTRRFAGLPVPDISDKPIAVRLRERDDQLTAAVKSGRVEIGVADTPTETGIYRELKVKFNA